MKYPFGAKNSEKLGIERRKSSVIPAGEKKTPPGRRSRRGEKKVPAGERANKKGSIAFAILPFIGLLISKVIEVTLDVDNRSSFVSGTTGQVTK